MPVTLKIAPQSFLNGEVHNWYRLVLGYSDHLVAKLIDRFGMQAGQKVLDPFCGTGTTLIECMKRGLDSVGVDANPSSVFAARVKTDWSLRGSELKSLLERTRRHYRACIKDEDLYRSDPTFLYLEGAGFIERGWVSPKPLRKAIAIKKSISRLRTGSDYRNALMLALVAEVVDRASNVKFGPELYCGPVKEDVDVFAGFEKRIKTMAQDLKIYSSLPRGSTEVFLGDARELDVFLGPNSPGPYHGVICSPPYPTEHDYTRNSRLELAFLEEVIDRKTLQTIKRGMIRSHTKGIYKGDNDSAYVEGHPGIETIIEELEPKAEKKTHGFARLYTTVVREYFGGMARHFKSLIGLLAPGAYCAYVVGDQSSYLRVHIPTAEILATIAENVGFDIVEIEHWRSRWSSTTSKEIDENILILRKPDKQRS